MIESGLIEKYKKASKRLVLLDYDGTLVNYEILPDNATPSTQMLDVLEGLINDPETKVIILTGREHQDIDKFIGCLPMDIIAEHGAMIKENGIWKKQIIDNCLWKNAILPLMNKATMNCPESFVEEKCCSLAWHYRAVEKTTGYIYSRKLIREMENVSKLYDFKIIDGNKVLEIVTPETNKGNAIHYITDLQNYNCILCIGDDRTDEDMFEYLLNRENAITIKVGEGYTTAKHRLGSVQKVLSFLKLLTS